MQARELTGVLVLNKVDLVHPKERLLRLADGGPVTVRAVSRDLERAGGR